MFLTKSFVWVKVVSGPGWTDVLRCSDDARVRPLDEREDCQKRGTLGHNGSMVQYSSLSTCT